MTEDEAPRHDAGVLSHPHIRGVEHRRRAVEVGHLEMAHVAGRERVQAHEHVTDLPPVTWRRDFAGPCFGGPFS